MSDSLVELPEYTHQVFPEQKIHGIEFFRNLPWFTGWKYFYSDRKEISQ